MQILLALTALLALASATTEDVQLIQSLELGVKALEKPVPSDFGHLIAGMSTAVSMDI